MPKALDSISSTTYNSEWWCMLAIPALRRLRQEVQMFKVMSIDIVLEAHLEYMRSYMKEGRREGQRDGRKKRLETGLTARADICKKIHMLAHRTKVQGS